MTLFIEGLAIPLDTKNVNGWGVPSTETTNVINSLKASTLKICPGEAHACDYSEDPNGRIGVFDSAWEAAGGVYARYKVTDSVAERKLKEGTWNDLKWSMYGDSKTNPRLNDGWAGSVSVKSMTLVKNPAWSQAHYQIAASEEDVPTGLRLFSDFIITASIEGDKITPELENEIKELKAKLAASDKSLTEKETALSAAVSEASKTKAQLTELQASVTELTASQDTLKKDLDTKTALVASLDALKKDLEAKTTLIASLEKEKAGSVPMTELKTIIAAAIEEHDQQLKTVNAREEAFQMFAAARESLGLETKQEDFTTLSAADLTKLAEDLGTVKLSAAQIRYPANPTNLTGFTVGRPGVDGIWRSD